MNQHTPGCHRLMSSALCSYFATSLKTQDEGSTSYPIWQEFEPASQFLWSGRVGRAAYHDFPALFAWASVMACTVSTSSEAGRAFERRRLASAFNWIGFIAESSVARTPFLPLGVSPGLARLPGPHLILEFHFPRGNWHILAVGRMQRDVFGMEDPNRKRLLPADGAFQSGSQDRERELCIGVAAHSA